VEGTILVGFFFFVFFFASASDNYKNNIYEENDELREKINIVVKENVQIVNMIKELEVTK